MKRLLTLAAIGALTLGASITAYAPLTEPFHRLTSADRDLIERVVMAEARGECFDGMKAVAQVIFHRLTSPRWPSTVAGVVKAEFAKPWRGEISRQVRQAVHEVFDLGLMAIQAPVYFFMNPKTASKNGAAWQKANTKRVAIIGSHEFRR